MFIWANFSGCHAGASASPAEDSEAEGGTRVVPRPAQQRRRQESLIGAGLANLPHESYHHFPAKMSHTIQFPKARIPGIYEPGQQVVRGGKAVWVGAAHGHRKDGRGARQASEAKVAVSGGGEYRK